MIKKITNLFNWIAAWALYYSHSEKEFLVRRSEKKAILADIKKRENYNKMTRSFNGIK